MLTAKKLGQLARNALVELILAFQERMAQLLGIGQDSVSHL